jgi:hypothetical protein
MGRLPQGVSRVLVLCVAVGLAASVLVLAQRFRVELAYRTVEIAVDGDDWATLARMRGMSRQDLYGELYQRGVRGVALYAASLRRLADMGLLTYMTGADVLNAARVGALGGPLADLVRRGQVVPNRTYVVGSLPVLRLVQAGFAVQRGASYATLVRGSGPVLELGGRGRDLDDASLGILPQEVEAASSHHLAIDLRVRNFREVAPGGLEAFFGELRQLDRPLTLIFDRDQVLGYDRMIPEVATAMRESHFPFGLIESFSAKRRQKGEGLLARLVAPDVIRVFSLTPEELAGLTPAQARDKYVLAARERNVRILYVRPFLATSAGLDPIQVNLDYVASIASQLERYGFALGRATPLPPVSTPAPVFLLVAVGIVAGSALATAEVAGRLGGRVSVPWVLGLAACGLAATVLAVAVHHVTLWRQLLAFAAALAFPTLAILWVQDDLTRDRPDPAASAGRVLVRSAWGLWKVSLLSALGGILVAAVLTQWQFMMELRVFLGVKAAHVIPVVLAGLLLAAASAPEHLGPRLRAWLRQPLLLQYGIAVIVVGVVAVYALGRTGNAGLPLASLELKSRVLLQHLLVARPRTKEYLIGHPFMMLAFALALTGWRRWVLPAAMVGMVGQVGMVNSFSHIHTPLVYVLLRTVYALALGTLLGAVLVAGLLGTRRWWPPDLRAAGRETSPVA